MLFRLPLALASFASLIGIGLAQLLSSTPTMTPSRSASRTPSCIPQYYAADLNGDGLVDTEGAQWYGWYNVDMPSATGDFENIGYLNGQYSYALSSELSFCLAPLNLICVSADAAETPWNQLPYVITYDPNFGCSCVNSQNGWDCPDLKVKYLCPSPALPIYYGCQPPTGYIPVKGANVSSLSATPSPSVSPSPTPSCSPKVFFADTNGDGLIDVEGAQWYGWFSIDGPDTGGGEYETIDYVNGLYNYSILSDLAFCPFPLDVQCVDINSEVSWENLPHTIHYNPHLGCWCETAENGRQCPNLKIKYLCPPQQKQAVVSCYPPAGYISADNLLASFSGTVSGTATKTPTGTGTGTGTRTATQTPSRSGTPTSSETSTGTPSETPIGTSSYSATGTPTPTETASNTPSQTSSHPPSQTSTVSVYLAPSVSEGLSLASPSQLPVEASQGLLPSQSPPPSFSASPGLVGVPVESGLAAAAAAAPSSNDLDSPAIGGITVGVLAFVAALAALAALAARRRKKKAAAANPMQSAQAWEKNPVVAADLEAVTSSSAASLSQKDLFRASLAAPLGFAAMNPMHNKKMAFAQMQIK